jgi:hypothetical protein
MVTFWKIADASSEVAAVDFLHFLIYAYLLEGRSTHCDPLKSTKQPKGMVIHWMAKVEMDCEEG